MPVRKKAVRHTPKTLASASVHIDPIWCNSMVSYRVIQRSSTLFADVQIADCDRKVTWYFDDSKSSVTKIDKAIAALQEFREKFMDAQAASPKRRRTGRK